jgi:hypothetical protein
MILHVAHIEFSNRYTREVPKVAAIAAQPLRFIRFAAVSTSKSDTKCVLQAKVRVRPLHHRSKPYGRVNSTPATSWEQRTTQVDHFTLFRDTMKVYPPLPLAK